MKVSKRQEIGTPNKCCSHSEDKGAYYPSSRLLETRKGLEILGIFLVSP